MKPGDLVHLPASGYLNDYLSIFEEPDCSNLIGRMYFGETGIFLDQKIHTNWHRVITSSGSIGWLFTADLEAIDETKTR